MYGLSQPFVLLLPALGLICLDVFEQLTLAGRGGMTERSGQNVVHSLECAAAVSVLVVRLGVTATAARSLS